MKPARILYVIALIAIMAVLGWRVVASGQGRTAPGDDRDPVDRLADRPLDGDAFSDLAVASVAAQPAEGALDLHQIAARRDPRDLRIRAWLADHYLRASDYPAALGQMDVILRLSPDLREVLPPAMVQWADNEQFADALSMQLRGNPDWAPSMMAALRDGIARPGARTVLAALHSTGDLDDRETAFWLDALMESGEWAPARRHWARGLGQEPATLPVPYNGDFEQDPSQQGFDWRTGRQQGTYTEFIRVPGTQGRAAHMVFLGRPVTFADLEQPLVLPPGRYRLRLDARAAGLRSDQGLRWTVACHGQPRRPLASSEALEGTFEWREVAMMVEVPATGCPGQWLRLSNPAPRGSARTLAGELWFDNLEIEAVPMASAPGS